VNDTEKMIAVLEAKDEMMEMFSRIAYENAISLSEILKRRETDGEKQETAGAAETV